MVYYNFLSLHYKTILKWHQVIRKMFALLLGSSTEGELEVKLVAKFL